MLVRGGRGSQHVGVETETRCGQGGKMDRGVEVLSQGRERISVQRCGGGRRYHSASIFSAGLRRGVKPGCLAEGEEGVDADVVEGVSAGDPAVLLPPVGRVHMRIPAALPHPLDDSAPVRFSRQGGAGELYAHTEQLNFRRGACARSGGRSARRRRTTSASPLRSPWRC